jgi:hypothetical protein
LIDETYPDKLLVFGKRGQLLVLELACLVEVLADQELQVAAIDGLIISLENVANESSVNHLLLASGLRADELGKGRPDLIDISELLLHDGGERLVLGILCILSIFQCHYL